MSSIYQAKVPIRWSVRFRLLLSMLFAGLTALLLPAWLHLASRILCIWDVGMVCFLGLSWKAMLRATPSLMSRKAKMQDAGRLTILSLFTAAACASLLALGFLLQNTKNLPLPILILHLGLSVVTIVGSWLLLHTIFALHYAHEYYQDDLFTPGVDDIGGLDFPGEIQPDYWDFLYYSFVVGMTCQVSDVQVTSRAMRRLTLVHGVLSFFLIL